VFIHTRFETFKLPQWAGSKIKEITANEERPYGQCIQQYERLKSLAIQQCVIGDQEYVLKKWISGHVTIYLKSVGEASLYNPISTA